MKMHPTQEVATEISLMLIQKQVPINIALSALSVTLIAACKQEGMTKAEIINKVANTIDTMDGRNDAEYR